MSKILILLYKDRLIVTTNNSYLFNQSCFHGEYFLLYSRCCFHGEQELYYQEQGQRSDKKYIYSDKVFHRFFGPAPNNKSCFHDTSLFLIQLNKKYLLYQ